MTELSHLPNPFQDNVVQDAWQSTVDIAEIHARAFEACKAGIESAARAVPDSLLIYGEAGSGKTHLLARLQRHLTETARSAPDKVLHCVFSFVRLQTSAQLLWQHLRRRLASDLMRREERLTQLQRLVAHQLGIVAGRSARAGILELRVLRTEDEETLSQHLQSLTMKLDLPRDLCVVIEHLVFNRNVRDASAWLAGDSLPESVLNRLGLGVDDEEDREESARRIVTALCRLAGETLPMVFCFDQVESLQRTANDDEALFRFGRMAADLYDADPNVFLVTCLQSSFLDQFTRAVRKADFDRISRNSELLDSLTPRQVESLVLSRLSGSTELAPLRAQHPAEPFYPLTARVVQELTLESPCVPRRILALAARAFEQARSGRKPAGLSTEQFLEGELQERQKKILAALEPADTQRILVQGATILEQFVGGKLSYEDVESSADFLITGERDVAVNIRNEVDGRSLTPKLRALLSRVPRPDDVKLVIVRDPRLPIPKTALKAREYLKTLQERGAVLLEPTVDALAALDALSTILADAKSGDLANEDAPLEASAVLEWLKGFRKELALEPVEELIRGLFEEPSTGPDGVEQDLADLLSHERVIAVELAAQILGYSSELVLEIGRKASGHYLLLEGPPTLIVDIAGVATEGEAEAE